MANNRIILQIMNEFGYAATLNSTPPYYYIVGNDSDSSQPYRLSHPAFKQDIENYYGDVTEHIKECLPNGDGVNLFGDIYQHKNVRFDGNPISNKIIIFDSFVRDTDTDYVYMLDFDATLNMNRYNGIDINDNVSVVNNNIICFQYNFTILYKYIKDTGNNEHHYIKLMSKNVVRNGKPQISPEKYNTSQKTLFAHLGRFYSNDGDSILNGDNASEFAQPNINDSNGIQKNPDYIYSLEDNSIFGMAGIIDDDYVPKMEIYIEPGVPGRVVKCKFHAITPPNYIYNAYINMKARKIK